MNKNRDATEASKIDWLPCHTTASCFYTNKSERNAQGFFVFFAGYPVAQSNGSVWVDRMASAAAREPPVGLGGFQVPPFGPRLIPAFGEFGPV